MHAATVVLDTNIILDAWVFKDPATAPLLQALQKGGLLWISTQPMRDELERVLAYPQIAGRLALHQIPAAVVLAQFDAQAQTVAVPPKASVTCKDPDDQKFIDLAVAHHSMVLSKDKAVLSMTKRLAVLGVVAKTGLN